MLLNDLMKQFNETVGETGPKFTGYWKSKDPAPAGKKMVGEEEKTLEASTLDTDIEFEPGPDTEFDKKELAALLTQKLTNLAPKEERAIRLKIFYDYTFDQIGEKFGVTGTRARDIFNRGIRKLKHPSRSREMRPFLEDENPTDKVTMDIPLFLRMMEYAKEDAKTDMDLHDVTERAIALMKEHEYLCMDNYNDLVGGEATGGEQPTNEFKDTAQYGDDSGKNINHEIFQLLKNGATVYSNAAGRMGKVLKANNDGVVIASKRGKGFTSFNSGDPVKIKQDENEPNTYHIINEEKKGLYYYVNKRKKAGTSRSKDHAKAPSAQDWKNAAKTAKESIDEDFQWTNPNLSQDEHNKVNKLIQQKLKSKTIDVDKLVKDPRPYKDRLPQGKETAPMPVYDRNVPSFMPTSKVKPKQQVSASKDAPQTDEDWMDDLYSAGRNFADTASLGTYKYARAGADWAAKNAMHQLGYADKGTDYQKELDQEVEKLDKDWKENPGASLAGMGAALAIPVAGEYGAAVKGAQGLAGQALDTYSKAVKMYPLAKAALGYKDMKNPKVEDVELEENLLSRIAGLVGAYYGAQMGIPDAIMSTMDMPLGTYELTQHILGGVAGYALGATMGDVAIGSLKALTKRMLRGALNKAIQSIKGGTPQDQAWKNYEAEVKAQYEKIKAAAEQGNKQEPKLFDKTTTEGKIKGVDGKACWPGKRYAGKEKKADGTYKDICVPVKKGK